MSKEEHLHLELEMLQSQFQASEPSGSEEEFLNIFLYISIVQTQDLPRRGRLDPETNLVKEN